jgi:phage FluMu gp28-like protein
MVVQDRGIPKVSSKLQLGADGEKRHGDSAIAGLLYYYASQKELPVFDYLAVPRQSRAAYDGFSVSRRSNFSGW